MKPSFALDFRDGVIALLHRTSRGWQQVGATPIDASDLTEALSYLRSTALGLSPRGLATKLVIPNEQILYTQVHAPGPEVAKRRKQIKAALEGLTPYKVDDLVYDWWGSGPEVHVAVVARETLAEAEAFAAEHRFNPVSFVAAPDEGSYAGEPFFGPSALAATLLADGEKVERDPEPITVVAREYPKADFASTPSQPAASVPATDGPVTDGPVTDGPGTDGPGTDGPVASPTAASEPEPEPLVFGMDEPAAIEQAVAEASPAMVDPVEVKPTETAPAPETVAQAPEPVAAPTVAADDPLPDFSTARAPAAGATAFDPANMELDLVDEAPMALDVTDEPQEPPVRSASWPINTMTPAKPAAAAEDDLPASPASSIIAAFASRRSAEENAAVQTGPVQTGPVPTGSVQTGGTPADFAAAAARAKKAPTVGPAPMQRPTVPRPAFAKPAAAPGASRNALPFPARTQAGKLPPFKPKVGIPPPGAAGLKHDRNVVPLAKPASEPTPDAATGPKPAIKGLTGLDGRPLPSRGRPRYLGLILTGLLLLALALVAAWSSFYLTSNDIDPGAVTSPNPVASATSDPDPALTPAALPSVEDEALADGQDPELAADSLVAADPAAGPEAAGTADATTTEPAAAPADVAAEPETTLAAVVPDATADPAAADTTAADTATETAAADTAVAGPATETAAADTAAADTAVADTAGAGTAVAGTAVAGTATEPAAKTAVVEPETAPLPEPAPGTSVVTDAAVAVTPGNDPQDEIFLAAADTPPQTSDPLVMPQVTAGSDPPPGLAAPPPPFGTVYTFDADGRIQPTPEGIMTPEGVLLIAGPPKVVPPVRPAALVQAAAPTAEPVAAVPAVVAEPIASDPALAGKKPKPRPAALVDPNATAGQQGEALAPAADSRFASARPQKRPAALTRIASAEPAATEVVNEAAAASLAANGVQASTSALAVAVSRKPAARPSGMDQAVDAAVAAAVSAPDPEPAAQPEARTQTASLAPEEQVEPEVEAPAPRLPTNASVAKQATVKNALNLSRVSLVGIFGTSSGRYALVRQPGGGVKKVVVGDTIDGGKIAAISATAVQYQKGGRMLTLSLPKG